VPIHLRRLWPAGLLGGLLLLSTLPLVAGALPATPPTPQPAFCGGAYWGDTSAGANHIEAYPCRPTWAETGPEQYYQLHITTTQPLTLTLSHPPGSDLDLFLLENGDLATCHAADASLVLEALSPGAHTIIVDGFNHSQGPYLLEIDCQEPPLATTTPTPTPFPTATSAPTATPTPALSPTPTPTRAHLTHFSYFPQQQQDFPPPTPQPLTLVLQPGSAGYDGVRDSSLNAWEIATNYANLDRLWLRQPDIMAPILHFDLSPLPAQAHIVEAKLGLWTLSQSNPNAADVGLYALNRPWDSAAVTWIHAQPQDPWAIPGANGLPTDRSALPYSQQAVAAVARWYEWDLSILAQHWLQQPADNHGVLLKAFSAARVQYAFASAEYHNPAARPRLTIRYWTPTPTP